ncbi:MAG: cellulase family glycosylhydrolase [Candidatus Moranbacteria bacterium]|nr:cellulase family glycosylhydrolase [Candidatus Moranbacteria bacterium]
MNGHNGEDHRSFRFVAKSLGIAVAFTLVLAGGFFAYFNLPGPAPREDVSLGVTFSQRYARDLGVDWKAAYLAVLDDLGVRKLRLQVYWDIAEPSEGEYDFSDTDWMLDEAAKRGVEVILVVGQREPRWPECHIPAWVSENGADAVREARLTDFIGETVRRYRDRPEIRMWQVENEPFVKFFGTCPVFSREYFDREIAYVRSLDPSRPILVTDSGEFSTWTAAAARGDVLGTTMYRKVHNPAYGYVTYPLGPNYYRFKAELIRLLTGKDRFIVAELQAEPWADGWVAGKSVAEQYETMNPDLLREYVGFARRVGFPEAYLWGAEWWYWLRENKGEPAVWDTARTLFREGEKR